MAADFTARATRTHAWAASKPRINAMVAPTLPSDVSLPSRRRTGTVTTTTMAAVMMLAHHTTRRRWNRSMKTPMNGDSNVYGT